MVAEPWLGQEPYSTNGTVRKPLAAVAGTTNGHGAVAFEFGAYELDREKFELRCHGRRVHVQPKILRLLLYLVANRERVVPSPELLHVLWRGETVTGASLKKAIRGARMTLGDDGDGQTGIVTVRSYGYRFVLPVEERRAAPPIHARLAEAPNHSGALRAQALHAAIERHLDALSEECRGVLRAASVLGCDFDSKVVIEVVGASSEGVLAEMAAAVRAKIVRASTTGPGRYAFVHGLIRDELYEQIPVRERARLHARAGLALEGRGCGADPACLSEVAHHFAQAADLATTAVL